MTEPVLLLTLAPPSAIKPAPVELVVTGSDRDAIETWLGAYRLRSVHTVRSFRREAERFLMWLEASKGPADRHFPVTTVDDASRYLDFLGAPREFPPALLQRYGRKEQPFNGPLARSSMNQALVILHRLFEALRNIPGEGGDPYVRMNPFVLLRNSVTDGDPDGIEEALTVDEMAAVLAAVEDLPRETTRDRAHYARTRWIFQLLYRAWLRRGEAAALTMGSFVNSPDGWWIKLVGKGNKAGRIVATEQLMRELRTYRTSLGLSAYPAPGETRPAILAVIGKDKPIGDQALYMICKTIFAAAADRLAETDSAAAERLRASTPHWMRHTGVSHAMDSDVDPRLVQAQARHSSLKTTSLYDHKERRRWRSQFEGMAKGDPEGQGSP